MHVPRIDLGEPRLEPNLVVGLLLLGVLLNERLQQKFNSHTFTQEESLYVAEGAPFDKVPFLDNTPVLELLSAKKPQLGVLILLDEEVRTPQGSDAKWLAKIDVRTPEDISELQLETLKLELSEASADVALERRMRGAEEDRSLFDSFACRFHCHSH